MNFNKLVYVLPLCTLLTGCFVTEDKYNKLNIEIDEVKAELNTLRNNLGGFQYVAIDPEIIFNTSDVEFLEPKTTYSSSLVKFKINLNQTNEMFLLKGYHLKIRLAVLDENGNEIKELSIFTEVNNGVLALAETLDIYGVKKKSMIGYKLTVKSYNWYPINSFSPKKS